MITAKKAKELVELNKTNVERELAVIERQIEDAAKDGKTSILLSQPRYKIGKDEDSNSLPYTPFQDKIFGELEKNGFEIGWNFMGTTEVRW